MTISNSLLDARHSIRNSLLRLSVPHSAQYAGGVFAWSGTVRTLSKRRDAIPSRFCSATGPVVKHSRHRPTLFSR
jgi:hypothetical protein